MVSIAIAVLPDWRSPKISSRCPLPMGTSASITFIPVCRGTFTAARFIMAGAGRSTGIRSVTAMASLPSIGLPKGLITLPINALPTAISITRPVRSTSSPAFNKVSSPSKIVPISCSSILKAIPNKFPGNFNSSSKPAPGRPETLTIPSDTLLTVPTSRGVKGNMCFSTPSLNWSNVLFIVSLNSFAGMLFFWG